ncbi:LysM peptidoglycan-binding domain-containing protein [Patescibacteria group bacterium]
MQNNNTEGWLKRFLKSLRMNESAISMALGAVVVVVVGILIYNYFSSVNKQVQPDQIADEGVVLVEENGELVPENLPKTHTVSQGEHLWSIAEKYYGTGYNWTDIAAENGLLNANVVTEGQELTIPKKAVKMVDLVKTEQAQKTESSGDTILRDEYIVQTGDSLWDISVRAYGDGYQWTKVWESNKDVMPNPDLIETGMALRLPR